MTPPQATPALTELVKRFRPVLGAKPCYLVYENWVRIGKFDHRADALTLQEQRMAAHPFYNVRVFHDCGEWLRLVSDSHYQDGHFTLQQLKGGNEDNMTNGRDNKPVRKFQAGAISAALWPNKMTLRDGRQIETLSVTLDRRYKDSDGEWKSSGSLREADIPKALLVLAKAYEFLTARAEGIADASDE